MCVLGQVLFPLDLLVDVFTNILHYIAGLLFSCKKMVRLTIDLIARGTSGYTKKKRDETMTQYLKRLTHLYLENKGIDEVVNKHT